MLQDVENRALYHKLQVTKEKCTVPAARFGTELKMQKHYFVQVCMKVGTHNLLYCTEELKCHDDQRRVKETCHWNCETPFFSSLQPPGQPPGRSNQGA